MRALALILSLLPFGLWAEEVQVRSGEHPGFSRLVITFAQPTEWRFGRDDSGYEFRAARDDVALDVSQVFQRIPRSRIAEVAVGPGNVLRIERGCNCHSESFEISPGKVVIDIKDGADGETAPLLKAAQSPQTDAPPAAEPVSQDVAKASTAALPSPGTLSAHRAPLPFLGAAPSQAAEPEPVEETTALAAPATDVETLRNILVQEIGRAAMQGLVEAEIDLPAPPRPDVQPAPAPPETKPQAPPKPPQAPGLRIETAVDRDLPRGFPLQTTRGSKCYPDSHFDIGAWQGGGAPMNMVSKHRLGLVGEFDRVDQEHLVHLIETYLGIGFGREAASLIDVFAYEGDRAALFRAMARIVDLEPAEPGNVLQGQLACQSDVAMWAVLAHEQLPRGEYVNVDAVAAAFSELPIAMRRHLGDPLAERFLEAGDTDTVARLFAAIDRAPGDHGPGFDMMTARIEVAEGDSASADQVLGDIVARDVPLSPEALALRLERRNAESLAASDEDLGNAEALAFEYAGTEIGSRLLRAWTISNAYSGQFGAAFAQLAIAPDDQKNGLAGALWDPLVQFAPDADFLSHVFYMIQTGLTGDLPAPARLALAKRISALGFQAQALEALGPPEPEQTAEARLLRGRIALNQQDPRAVLRHIAGLPGADADALRAEAHLGLAELETAATLFAAAGRDTAAAAAAWQIGDWAALTEKGSDLQRAFADMQTGASAATDRALSDQSEFSLAEMEDLATEAASARQLLETMLRSQQSP